MKYTENQPARIKPKGRGQSEDFIMLCRGNVYESTSDENGEVRGGTGVRGENLGGIRGRGSKSRRQRRRAACGSAGSLHAASTEKTWPGKRDSGGHD